MFKMHWLATSLVGSALCAQLALADINGGGSTLPQSYYLAPGVLTAGFAPYIGSDLGDKEAFLNNDYNRLIPGAPTRNVHWVATESKLRGYELDGYSMAHGASWGPLIQVPVAATAVAIRFNKAGIGNLDLSVNDVCGIFSGRLDRWEYLSSGAGTYGPLTVVYPQGPSGTTELFTRFLNAKCSEPAGPFAVTRFFANAYPASVPQTAKSAQGSPQIMEVLNATPGSVTFIGSSHASSTLAGLEDGSKVARVGGIAPTPANIVNAISLISPPTANLSTGPFSDPIRWVPVFAASFDGNDPSVVPFPSVGYPILGFSTAIFSQCYADATQTAQVRAFFARQYGSLVTNDAALLNNNLQPLPAIWKAAIRNAFVTPASLRSIGNPNICNAIGRPF